jgi:hypothetical protein
MLLTAIIVGGIVASTLIAAVFDYLGKKIKSTSPELEKRISILENRQDAIEGSLLDRDEKISLLTKEVSFVNKLLEQKTKE